MSRTSTGHFYKSTANKNGRAPDPGNGTGSGIGLWEASSANEVKAGAGLVASACIECHSRVGRCTSFGHDAAPTVQCGECQRRFHAACVGEDVVVLHGDVFYSFVCSQCSRSRLDEFARTPPTWLALTQLVLYHLTVTTPDREDRWFSWKDELCAFIDTNWDHIMIGKTRTPTWHNTIAKELSTHPDIFSSGKLHNMKGCWALVDVIPPPESKSAFAGAKKSKPSGPSSSSSKPPAKRPSSKPQPPTPAPPAPRHQHPQLSSAQKSLLRIHAFDSSDSSDEDNSTSRSATISAPPLPKLLPSKKKQKKDEAGVKEEEMRQHQESLIVAPSIALPPSSSFGTKKPSSIFPVATSTLFQTPLQLPQSRSASPSTAVSTRVQTPTSVAPSLSRLALPTMPSLESAAAPEEVRSILAIKDPATNSFESDGIEKEISPFAPRAAIPDSVLSKPPVKGAESKSKLLLRPLSFDSDSKEPSDKFVQNESKISEPFLAPETTSFSPSSRMSVPLPWKHVAVVERAQPQLLVSPSVRERLTVMDVDSQIAKCSGKSISAPTSGNSGMEKCTPPQVRGITVPSKDHSDSWASGTKPINPLASEASYVLIKKCETLVSYQNSTIARLRRRLLVQQARKLRGMRRLDLDAVTQRSTREYRIDPEPMPFIRILTLGGGVRYDMDSEGKIVLTVGKADLLGEDCISKRFEFVKRVNVTCIPSAFSFASKVCGDPFSSRNLTLPIARVSSYTGNNLRPYIWREFLSNDSSLPPYYKLLQLIQSLGSEAESGSPSIDYCYFQELHRTQVNEILSRQFWPGIDVSEHLSIPDLSIIALYKRLVVGCGFILPNGYISFIMVRPGWQRAGIARFMLFHLIQSVQSYGKDITLHVSANNPAMLLYQHFGFKAEQFIVNFYDKYLPANSQDCKNAFFLRLRR